MEKILLTIQIVSGILFIGGFLTQLYKLIIDSKSSPGTADSGIIFVIAIWKSSLVLGILGIVFLTFSLIIGILYYIENH